MRIDVKDKYSHIKWLNLNLTKHSNCARINESSQAACLFITLQPIQLGKSKPIEPICRLKYKQDDIVQVPIFWEFREKWWVSQSAKRRGKEYEFCGLYVKLLYGSDSEVLSLHWTSPSPKEEPYQPHWHIKLKTSPLLVAKIHFPLNESWRDYFPSDMDTYHEWLKGLLQFLESEFPRCLGN